MQSQAFACTSEHLLWSRGTPLHTQPVHGSRTGALALDARSRTTQPTEGPPDPPTGPIQPIAQGRNHDVPALEGLRARQEGDGAAKGAADQLDAHLVQQNHTAATADALAARLLPAVCRHRRGVPGTTGPHAPPVQQHDKQSASTTLPRGCQQVEQTVSGLHGTPSSAPPPTGRTQGAWLGARIPPPPPPPEKRQPTRKKRETETPPTPSPPHERPSPADVPVRRMIRTSPHVGHRTIAAPRGNVTVWPHVEQAMCPSARGRPPPHQHAGPPRAAPPPPPHTVRDK